MRRARPLLAEDNDSKRLGTRGFKSCRRFDGQSKTITAMLNFYRSCWDGIFLSTVTKTSKLFSAKARSCPFSMLAQPIWGAVWTEWPVSNGANFRGKHSSRRILTLLRCGEQFFLGVFQEYYCHFSGNSRKVVKKLINRITGFEIIEKSLNRHPGSRKARRATHDLRV